MIRTVVKMIGVLALFARWIVVCVLSLIVAISSIGSVSSSL